MVGSFFDTTCLSTSPFSPNRSLDHGLKRKSSTVRAKPHFLSIKCCNLPRTVWNYEIVELLCYTQRYFHVLLHFYFIFNWYHSHLFYPLSFSYHPEAVNEELQKINEAMNFNMAMKNAGFMGKLIKL